MNPSEVLTKTELKEMADIMSDAFLEHQNWTHLIGPKRRRKRALYRIFLMIYKVINQHGIITTISKEDIPIGYMTFMLDSDPKQISFWRVLQTGGLFDFLLFIFRLNFREIRGILSYMKAYNKGHLQPRTDAMHLYMVGILPAYRSKGYMSFAFRQMTQQFKEQGITHIVLETSDESNIPIYKKMNFTLDQFIITKKEDQKIYFFTLEL